MESTPAALISWSLFDSTRGLSQHATHRHLHCSSSCRPTLVPRSVHIHSFLIFNIFQAVLCLLQCITYYPVSICVNLSFSTEFGLTPMVQHLLSVGVQQKPHLCVVVFCPRPLLSLEDDEAGNTDRLTNRSESHVRCFYSPPK